MIIGELEPIQLGAGVSAPFWVLDFDKFGYLDSPETAKKLKGVLEKARDEGAPITDLIVLSHGWNNTYSTAIDLYRDFTANVDEILSASSAGTPDDFRPLVVGLVWPSTALVAPWARGPDIAAATDPLDDPEVRAAWEIVAERIDAEGQETLRRILAKPTVTDSDAEMVAALIAAAINADDEDDPGAAAVTAADVLEAWAHAEKMLSGSTASDDPAGPKRSAGGDTSGAGAPGPRIAGGESSGEGLFGKLVTPLRLLTVRTMKDRAGLVGHRGFGPLLAQLMTASPETRVHVVGHSYGARLLLNAVCRPKGTTLPHPVRSMLLLQPAVNHLCFARELPDSPGRGGGYQKAADLVDLPILTTFSPHDGPLRIAFHHALFRPGDLGDVLIATDDEPPSRFAALGGYGPAAVVARRMPIKRAPATGGAPDRYDLDNGDGILALDGRNVIMGHGDVTTPATAWAFVNLLTTP